MWLNSFWLKIHFYFKVKRPVIIKVSIDNTLLDTLFIFKFIYNITGFFTAIMQVL